MNPFSFAHRDRRGMYTPCALTRSGQRCETLKDVGLLTAACGVLGMQARE